MQPIYRRALERFGQFQASVTAPGAKPLWQQVREILRLRSSEAKLSAAHYFLMNLGNRKLYGDVDLESFGGTTQTIELHRKLNSPHWDAIVTDKLVMSAVFSACGIPQPALYGVACRYRRTMGNVPVYRHKEELADFLRGAPYPIFCKPIKGGSAKGCLRVESYDGRSDRLQLATGGELSPEQFIEGLVDPEGWGFLFQEALQPHPDTLDICGGAVSGCRAIMLAADEGPRLFRLVWKLPAKGNFVDNFVYGKTGNWIADVDTETGKVRRVVSGAYTRLQINPRLPGGRDLVGEQIPDWEKLKSVLENAAQAFPGFRFQHWDVGLSSRGPVFYELNTAGSLNIVELAKGRGVLDENFRAFLARYGNQATRWHLAGGPPVS
ncbi:sugar-transfer associated ATP-grasp domain-containing protein [Gilvimarinus sp. F26214L]|uniref:sugar-transfer associated ATP-grasp domain-containing protein n=1 Tax=Gilvimarinus sp. DZF01 TaxID=3461371 RepID=UPI0040453577